MFTGIYASPNQLFELIDFMFPQINGIEEYEIYPLHLNKYDFYIIGPDESASSGWN